MVCALCARDGGIVKHGVLERMGSLGLARTVLYGKARGAINNKVT